MNIEDEIQKIKLERQIIALATSHTASGKALDLMGDIRGVKRNRYFLIFKESDYNYRKRICDHMVKLFKL